LTIYSKLGLYLLKLVGRDKAAATAAAKTRGSGLGSNKMSELELRFKFFPFVSDKTLKDVRN
jgi:hypothetical protein